MESSKVTIGINQASAIGGWGAGRGGGSGAGWGRVRSQEVAKATHFVRLLWPPRMMTESRGGKANGAPSGAIQGFS